MPELPEDVSSIIASVISGVKSQPAFMAMILLNLIVFVCMFMGLWKMQDLRHQEFETMMQVCERGGGAK